MGKEGKILKDAIKASRLSVVEIAEKTGISRAQLYNLMELDLIPQNYVDRLREVGIKIDTVQNVSSDKAVPYYDIDATAGNVTIFKEDVPEYIKQYITVPAFSDCDMFIGVSGHSMYPKYCSGELIALKKIEDKEIVAFGEAYLIVTKEQRLLKYIRKGTTKEHWLLASENREFEPFEIPIKKVLHLFIVKGKITKNII